MKFNAFHLLVLVPLMGCSENIAESPAKEMIRQVEPQSSDIAPQNKFGFMEAMEQGMKAGTLREPPFDVRRMIFGGFDVVAES